MYCHHFLHLRLRTLCWLRCQTKATTTGSSCGRKRSEAAFNMEQRSTESELAFAMASTPADWTQRTLSTRYWASNRLAPPSRCATIPSSYSSSVVTLWPLFGQSPEHHLVLPRIRISSTHLPRPVPSPSSFNYPTATNLWSHIHLSLGNIRKTSRMKRARSNATPSSLILYTRTASIVYARHAGSRKRHA